MVFKRALSRELEATIKAEFQACCKERRSSAEQKITKMKETLLRDGAARFL